MIIWFSFSLPLGKLIVFKFEEKNHLMLDQHIFKNLPNLFELCIKFIYLLNSLYLVLVHVFLTHYFIPFIVRGVQIVMQFDPVWEKVFTGVNWQSYLLGFLRKCLEVLMVARSIPIVKLIISRTRKTKSGFGYN